VRITAQLIDAATDDHLWSQSYDRQIADIFALEDEIARTITQELTGRLLPSAAGGAPAKPKIDPAAYTAYLQGRFFLNKRNDADMERAVDFFKQAITIEPGFADAHASLGHVYALLYTNGQRRDTLPAAKNEIAIALRLDPGNTQANLSKGVIAQASWNWMDAYAAYRKSLARNPGSSDALHYYAQLFWSLDLLDAALAAEQRAATIDPLAPVFRESVGDDLSALKRDGEAARAYAAALTIDPNFIFALQGLCVAYANTGRFEDARRVMNERLAAADAANGSDTADCGAVIALRSGNMADLRKYADDARRHDARGDITASAVGWFAALANEDEDAMRWYEKAYDDRDPQLFSNMADPDLPAHLTSSAAWKTFLQRPLIREWQAARELIAAEIAVGK
jgi:tetratricopeptide (TPR) repeat protein